MANLSNIITPTNVLTATNTATLTNKTINAANNTVTNVSLSTGVTGTLPVANGGTGAATLTANNVLLGNGTSALQVVAPSTSGNVLTSNGTTWTSAAPTSGAGTLQATASGALSDGSTVIINADGTVSVVQGSIETVFESAITSAISTTFDSTNNRVVIAYHDGGNSGFGTAVVGTVSGTSISFGTPVVFESASTNAISATYDSTNNRVVIAYRDSGNSGFGTAIVGTVSGTSISFGTAVVFKSANTTVISTTFDSANDRVVIVYQDGGNSNFGTAIVGTVSGTSISFGSSFVFESASTSDTSATFDSTNDKVVIAYRDLANSSFGTAVAIDINIGKTNLTSENYIGISNGAYADTATATVQIVGSVDDAQSGLTAGQSFFVQLDGTLGLSPANPSVFAGTAVSATKLIVKG